jgi:phospholipase C
VVEPAGPLRLSAPQSPIEHVVIIVKENHGYDNYFGAFPGGDGASMPRSPNPPRKDPDHRHAAWLKRDRAAPRQQFTESDIPFYWDYARRFTLCDRYFTDVAGPSTPNHLMLIAADSPIVDNPSGQPAYVLPTLPAQLDSAGRSWGNYGGYVFELVKYTAGKQRSSQQFAADAAAGKLPAVSWLYAESALSEHPPDTPLELAAGVGNVTKGMKWTVDQVTAVVHGGLWPRVAIFITWDDWGGWWDHVTPPQLEKWRDGSQFRYGGRVGCLVLSPYARSAHVSHAEVSHVSVVKFCEHQFGLGSLNARTDAADAMSDCFDFSQNPLPPP